MNVRIRGLGDLRMEMMDMILWIIYPYMVAMIMMMGSVWQCDYSVLYSENKYFSNLSKFLLLTVKGLFTLSLFTGFAVFFNKVGNDSLDLLYWGISFITFRPNLHFINEMSLLTRMHMLVLFTFFLMYSFSRFVKVKNRFE